MEAGARLRQLAGARAALHVEREAKSGQEGRGCVWRRPLLPCELGGGSDKLVCCAACPPALTKPGHAAAAGPGAETDQHELPLAREPSPSSNANVRHRLAPLSHPPRTHARSLAPASLAPPPSELIVDPCDPQPHVPAGPPLPSAIEGSGRVVASGAPGRQAAMEEASKLQVVPLTPSKRRKCAEVCMELLTIEAVRYFTDRDNGPAAAAALEAVGFRVGRLLAERWAAIACGRVGGRVGRRMPPPAPFVAAPQHRLLAAALAAPACAAAASRWRPACRRPPRRYSKERPRLGDTLEVIKFICKDFWQAVFKKQVDNLKTNHRVGAAGAGGRRWSCRCWSSQGPKLLPPRCTPGAAARERVQLARPGQAPTRAAPPPQGIYVLQDNSFRWLLRVSPTAPLGPSASDAAKEEFRRAVHSQLYLPCGIVRGGCPGRPLAAGGGGAPWRFASRLGECRGPVAQGRARSGGQGTACSLQQLVPVPGSPPAACCCPRCCPCRRADPPGGQLRSGGRPQGSAQL
jgi:hypothetical protein